MFETIKKIFDGKKALEPEQKKEVSPLDKKQKLSYAKSIDSEKKTVTAYVSTFTWDRMNERFAKGAWNLENYKKNPVVLWSHDPSQPPIGKAVRIDEDENGLLAEAEFDSQNEFAMKIFSLFQRGFLSAFSVGFYPKQFEVEPLPDGTSKGYVFTDAELLEFSAVSIPANPAALVSRETAEIITKAFGPSFLEKESIKIEEEITEKTALSDDQETAIRKIIELAGVVKQKPMDETKMGLIKTAMDTLMEIINENTRDGVPMSDLLTLQGALKDLASVIQDKYQDPLALVPKLMKQIDRAIRRGE